MSQRVGYFGKLPGFEDYIGNEFSSEVLEAYKDWLQKALGQMETELGDGFSDRYEAADDLGFLLQFDGVRAALLGLVKSSTDSHGRRYPFTIFCETDAPGKTDVLALQLVSHQNLFRTASRMLAEGDGNFNITQQTHTITMLSSGLPLEGSGARRSFGAFVEMTSPAKFISAFQDPWSPAQVTSTIRCMFNALAPMRGSVSSSFDAVFRCPLSGSPATRELEVAFWSEVAGRLLQAPDQPVLVWNPHSVCLAMTPPGELLLTAAWSPQSSPDWLWDFTEMQIEEPPEANRADFDRLVKLLEAEDAKLSQLLELLSDLS